PISRRTLALAAGVLGVVVIGVLCYVWAGSWTVLQVSIVGPGGVEGPDDALLTIDGQPAKAKPGARRQIKLKKNRSYDLEVGYADLTPFKTNVTVSGAAGQSVELPLVFGRLVVVGVTPGADFALTNGSSIFLSNTTRNYTNAFARPGLWHLELKREGYLSANQ